MWAAVSLLLLAAVRPGQAQESPSPTAPPVPAESILIPGLHAYEEDVIASFLGSGKDGASYVVGCNTTRGPAKECNTHTPYTITMHETGYHFTTNYDGGPSDWSKFYTCYIPNTDTTILTTSSFEGKTWASRFVLLADYTPTTIPVVTDAVFRTITDAPWSTPTVPGMRPVEDDNSMAGGLRGSLAWALALAAAGLAVVLSGH